MTTTDDFTDAARKVGYGHWSMRDQRSAFEHGATWARDHLAAQEPTDYRIDVAMDAYAEASGQSVSRPWMEAAIHAYESAAQRDEEKRNG